MRITSLQLENFKNYEKLSFSFGDTNPTVLIGNNGQGKTNFLEAIVVLALSKSFQPLALKEMVNWYLSEAETGLPEFFRITGTVEAKGGESQLEVFCGKTRKYPKTLKVNDLKVKPKDYIGTLRIVLFTPQDLNIIMLSPTLRRRYVDLMISQVDKVYLEHLSKYQLVVKHRNKLLGAIQEKTSSADELGYWDEQLVEHGSYLLWKRREVFGVLNQRLAEQYQKISGEKVELEVVWKKEWGRGENFENHMDLGDLVSEFNEYISEKRFRDIATGSTCGGPHREDFFFQMNERNLANFGSRGECRSTILALKLAELSFITETTGESPVLLFDDVLSELDPDRQQNLLELFDTDQVIITSTHLDGEKSEGVWEVKGSELTAL
ncbi:MAG: DNA replication/repair protein RecF [Candidatus Gracilibacteria bacterium]|nr:DNA replication/repair protein RecF [Candidatus Gracilibacteria bacterium]